MMKAILAVVILPVFLVTGAGPVLAQYAPVPSPDSAVSQEFQQNRLYAKNQAEEQTKGAQEPAGAIKDPDSKGGAGAGGTVKEPKRAKKRAGNKPAQAAATKGMAAQTADIGTPNYSVSPEVKRDRRKAMDAVYLKYYAKPDQPAGEAFWVTERDGALMLVDPHISQNLR
jgi:hypothetical protein